MKKSALILIIIAVCLASCQKALLGPVTANTPVNNFEEMWKGYNEWYGMFEVRRINWDSLYTVYRPGVNDGTTNTELYNALARLITPLNDIHAFLQPTSNGLPRYESSAFYREHKVQQDFSISLVRQKYLPLLVTVNDKLHYGILPGNIGYVHFGAFDMPVSFYRQQMDRIMNALKTAKAIIVDIRNHEGGDDQVSRYIAGWFAKEEKLFMTVRKKSGPARNDFSQPENWYVAKQGSYQFIKPVVLLTTRWTASAGETFAWAMNTQEAVIQLGDTTAGGFTDVTSRELPNGWLYFVGVGDYRNAAGKSEEGSGVAPAIYITNKKDDIDAGIDKVLEKAISRLQ